MIAVAAMVAAAKQDTMATTKKAVDKAGAEEAKVPSASAVGVLAAVDLSSNLSFPSVAAAVVAVLFAILSLDDVVAV